MLAFDVLWSTCEGFYQCYQWWSQKDNMIHNTKYTYSNQIRSSRFSSVVLKCFFIASQILRDILFRGLLIDEEGCCDSERMWEWESVILIIRAAPLLLNFCWLSTFPVNQTQGVFSLDSHSLFCFKITHIHF